MVVWSLITRATARAATRSLSSVFCSAATRSLDHAAHQDQRTACSLLCVRPSHAHVDNRPTEALDDPSAAGRLLLRATPLPCFFLKPHPNPTFSPDLLLSHSFGPSLLTCSPQPPHHSTSTFSHSSITSWLNAVDHAFPPVGHPVSHPCPRSAPRPSSDTPRSPGSSLLAQHRLLEQRPARARLAPAPRRRSPPPSLPRLGGQSSSEWTVFVGRRVRT